MKPKQSQPLQQFFELLPERITHFLIHLYASIWLPLVAWSVLVIVFGCLVFYIIPTVFGGVIWFGGAIISFFVSNNLQRKYGTYIYDCKELDPELAQLEKLITEDATSRHALGIIITVLKDVDGASHGIFEDNLLFQKYFARFQKSVDSVLKNLPKFSVKDAEEFFWAARERKEMFSNRRLKAFQMNSFNSIVNWYLESDQMLSDQGKPFESRDRVAPKPEKEAGLPFWASTADLG